MALTQGKTDDGRAKDLAATYDGAGRTLEATAAEFLPLIYVELRRIRRGLELALETELDDED